MELPLACHSHPSADVSILPRVALPRVAIQFRDAVLMKC